jgi:TP901 family phage tail tape measure protein
MSEIDRIEVAITADPSGAESGFQRASKAAQDFDSKVKSIGSSDFGDKVEGEADQAVAGLKKAEDAADSLGSKLKNLDIGSGLSKISNATGKVADGMQKYGLVASAVGAPVGLLAKNSITMYADLESQIQRNTALLGGGKAEYEEILALSKELGASTPFDALEIGAGIEALAAAGYSLEEIKAAMPTITDMSIATGEDLNTMSEVLIATLSSYGESADKAGIYGDKLATIANISTASITDFGESMKYVGGIADAFNVDIDEVGAVIAALADVNIKGSMAGTGLRSVITDLANPTAKVKDIFAAFGLTMDELNPKTNDFVEILQKMKDAGVSDEALMAAFEERGGSVAIQMLSQLDKVKENYYTLQNESEGMLKEFSAKMRDTLKFVMDEMGGTISNIMIEIGGGLKPIVVEMGQWLNENQQTLIDFAKNAVEGLTPFVEKFLDLAKKIMDWFNSLPDDMQSKIGMLTGLGAAMATIGGPLLLLGSLPVRAISDVTGALPGLFNVAKGAGAGAGLGGLIGDIGGLGGAAGGALPNLAALFGPAGILAVGLGAGAIAAYATNFGQFRDNINGVIGELGEAASNISTGDYEQAGRDCAEAFGKGLESITDLTVAAISGVPGALTALNEFKTGMEQAAQEAISGFTSKITTDLLTEANSILQSIVLTGPEIVFEREKWKANMDSAIQAVKEAVSGIDLTAEGGSAANSFIDGFLAANFGPMSSVVKGALEGVVDGVIDFAVDTVAGQDQKKRDVIKGLPRIGEYVNDTEQYKEEVNRSIETSIEQITKKLIASGMTPHAAEQKAINDYYQNRNAHGAGSLKPSDLTAGTQTGMEGAAPVIAEQTGNSVAEALAKEKGWYDKGELDVAMAERFLEKNPGYDTSRFTEAAEETTKETKSSGEKIVKSLEELKTEAYNKDQDSFIFEDTKYKWDDASGDYIKWTKAESMAAERAKEQEKATEAAIKSQEKFIGQFEAGLNPQKVADTLYAKYGSDALKGKEFQIGDLLYKISQTESGGIKTSGTDEVSKKIIDALNTINSTNEKLQKELAKDPTTNKKGKITGGPDKAKIADYNNEIKAAQDILNKYGVSQTKNIESTDELNSSLGKTATSTSELDKSVTATGDNLIKFSEPVDVASGNVFTFSDAVSVATGTLAELGSLDIKSLIQKWLSEGEIGEAQQRKADDLGALYGKDMSTALTAGVAQQIAKEMPNWLKWQKENKGQSYEDLSQDKSALWYEIANTVLKSNYAGYSDPGTRDWTFRKYVDDRLNSDTQTIIDGLFQKSLDTFVKPFYGMESRQQQDTNYNTGLTSLAGSIEKIGLSAQQNANILTEYNQIMQDNTAYNGEALGYLAKWNQQTGKATEYTNDQVNQTTDLMNALGSLNNAQSLYQEAMNDGIVTDTEASGIQQALAESTRLMGEAGIDANTNLSGLPGALQALASAAQAALSQITSAVAMANAQISNVRKVGDWTLQTMSGLPTMAPSTPTNFAFASGGPVSQTGPAMLHQGEYVLRRDEVNKLTSGAPNVNLNINMSNSRFGSSEIQKDLPKRIARETRRALARNGI